MAAGWKRVRPKDRISLLPMSDGGDGFGEMMGAALGAKAQTLKTTDAAGRPCAARWWWHAPSRTAILEAAKVNGLAMLPPGRFHPFDLDTFGVGQALKFIAAKGAKRCLVGIGGSATNDAGFGMARALGWRFLDRAGKEILRWPDLSSLAKAVAPAKNVLPEITVAVDVQNPLLGPNGCSCVYGPQKGLKLCDIKPADQALAKLAQRFPKGRAFSLRPGAGAAGGLGFGLLAFANASLEPGFDLFANHSKLSARLKQADLVITGEGAIDSSSLMGKGVGELARLCRKQGLPCIGLAGVLPDAKTAARRFTIVDSIVPDLADADLARSKPKPFLVKLASQAAGDFNALGAGKKLR